MKKYIFMELVRRIQRQPQLGKKLKVFAALGVVTLIFTFGLAIWAGLSAVNYAVVTAGQFIQMPVTQTHLDQVTAGIEKVENIGRTNCWLKAQKMLNLEVWLNQPPSENFKSLKSVCWQ